MSEILFCKICGGLHSTGACQSGESILDKALEEEPLHPIIRLGTKSGEAFESPDLEDQKKWWHTVKAVKNFFQEKIDLFKEKNLSEEGQQVRKYYQEFFQKLEQKEFDSSLEYFEQILGEGIRWNEKEQKPEYRSFENQEQMRIFVDVLTERKYQKNEQKLIHTTYKEVEKYLKEEIKLWDIKKDQDPEAYLDVDFLEKAIENQNYSGLADQIDLCLKVRLDWKDDLNSKDDDGYKKNFVKNRYQSDNPLQPLLLEIENLRRYRKFLYDQITSVSLKIP